MLTPNTIPQSAELAAADALITQSLRDAVPTLDSRNGTAVRELLIRPQAYQAALQAQELELYQLSASLATAADPAADPAMVAALLGNLQYELGTGAKASGLAAVYGNEYRDYIIPAGYRLQYQDVFFEVPEEVRPEVADGAAVPVLEAPSGAPGPYLFVLPLQAVATGANANLVSGTVLDIPTAQVPGVVGAQTITPFTGGADPESIAEAVTRLPAQLGARSFESRNSTTALLTDNFSLRDVGVVPFDHPAQRRNLDNPYGLYLPGVTDIYVAGAGVSITQLRLLGTRVSDGVYTLSLPRSAAPGFQAVRAVVPYDTTGAAIIAQAASLPFTASYTGEATADSGHKFPTTSNASFNTLWQAATMTVTSVPGISSAGVLTHPALRYFSVEVYVVPLLSAVQSFVDGEHKSLHTDIVVRAAVPCLVSLSATLYKSGRAAPVLVDVRQALADYINSKQFGDVLSVSQLLEVCHRFDIVRVPAQGRGAAILSLSGRILSVGTELAVTGDTLDIADYEDAAAMIHPDTTLFCCVPDDIHLSLVSA